MIRTALDLPSRLITTLLVIALGPLAWDQAQLHAQSSPIGFEEEFALASDRAEAVEVLIPGTPNFYFYHCLLAEQAGDGDRVQELIRQWGLRSSDPRLQAIVLRHLLLGYQESPDQTLKLLSKRLGLTFDHTRQAPDEVPDLPTRLDPRALDAQRHLRELRKNRTDWLNALSPTGLWIIDPTSLNKAERRELLETIRFPDYPRLLDLILADLRATASRAFGYFPVHEQLLLSQLQSLAQRLPEILTQRPFVDTYVARLAPSNPARLSTDPTVLRAYLERLRTFAHSLGPNFNSFKSVTLYHSLEFERSQGRYDRGLFREYMKLPRRAQYINSRFFQRTKSPSHWATNSGNRTSKHLAEIGDDWPLVKDHLLHFFTTDESHDGFAPHLDEKVARRVFAEAKITNGAADLEKWHSFLDDPKEYERIKDRVDLDFAPTRRKHFNADTDVVLALDVKNVSTLLVKTYPINALNYYREIGREIDSSLPLDGLIAHKERVFEYDDPPWRRVRRTFEFPELKKPGVYVVEFIGGGIGSRAVIFKGRLRHTERRGAAGHVLQVLNEQNGLVPDSRVWLAGQEYRADEYGDILVPYTAQPDEEKIVLSQGDSATAWATLATLDHEAEDYALEAEIHLEPESLLAGATAPVLVRPRLRVSGEPASLQLLEDVRLSIVTTDRSGVSSRRDFSDVELSDDEVLVRDFRVPPRLRSVVVSLEARVALLMKGTKKELSAERVLFVNGVDLSADTDRLFLVPSATGYALELRGKSGEPRAHEPITLALEHCDFSEDLQVTLKTDANGRTELGELPRIRSLNARYGNSIVGWTLHGSWASVLPSALHVPAGHPVRIPYHGMASEVSPRTFAFFELRSEAPATNRLDLVQLVSGALHIPPLNPGNYLLVHRDGYRGGTTRLRVSDAIPRKNDLVSEHWRWELSELAPLHIQNAEQSDTEIVIRLGNLTSSTRCHLSATRFASAHATSLIDSLWVVTEEPELRRIQQPHSVYLTGRNLGDELRYILDRRRTLQFPGNPLARPGLLLNPWKVRETVTGRVQGAPGQRWGKGTLSREGGSPNFFGVEAKSYSSDSDASPNLDFLPTPAVLLANLIPDREGVVRVPLSRLAGYPLIRLVATDGDQVVHCELELEASTWKPRDLTLTQSLDPKRSLSEQRRVSAVQAGQSLTIEQRSTAKFETYDTLASVYQLYSALTLDKNFPDFEFVCRWPELDDDQKRTLYSQYACHELHLFLLRKDAEFFDTVVLPHLRNKRHKTFVDHYLLGDALSDYLDPWAYSRLNTLEKILLASRIPGEAAHTTKHIQDLHDLTPDDLSAREFAFQIALQRDALEALDKPIPESSVAPKDARAASPARNQDKKSKRRGLAAPKPRSPAEDSRDREDLAESARSLATERLERDAELRQRVRHRYRKTPPTQELAETYYYRVRSATPSADLIRPNSFWNDFAVHQSTRPGDPFLSEHVAIPTSNFSEMLCALAVLDLPFKADPVSKTERGEDLTLASSGGLIVFHEELRATTDEAPGQILVGQNFFRLDDRFEYDGRQRLDKFVTDEFIVRTVYGCQVVVTNPTSSPQRLELLLQVPAGSIPVQNGFVTSGHPLDLPPYGTQSVEYHFYFPRAGRFTHYPVHVSRGTVLAARAAPQILDVVERATRADKTSWSHVSQQGSAAEVLSFLADANLGRLPLFAIAWRLKDPNEYREFGSQLLQLLQRRHHFDPVLWSYSLLHDDPPRVRQFLRHQADTLATCGGWLDSPLVSIDPVETGQYEHLEYDPVINARIHPLGSRRTIENATLGSQYRRFLAQLCFKKELDDADHLAATYYLLLQDRIEEALARFRLVRRTEINTHLQYDYAAAYLDLFSVTPEKALAIARRYQDYPVDRWRTRFDEIARYVEAAKSGRPHEGDGSEKSTTELVATEPAFDFEIDGRDISVEYQNLTQVRANYYLMDVELLFSRQPFVQDAAGTDGSLEQWAMVRPTRSDLIELAPGGRYSFALPEEFLSANVIVELVAAGQRLSRACYSNALSVQLVENYGQLRVVSEGTGAPLPLAYVKVYAKTGRGKTQFYKDGYTDLLGRFDYASLSADELDSVERFSVLVLHESAGAVIQEAGPPKQ